MSSNGMTMAGILLKARSQEKNTILNEVQAQFAGFGKILHWASKFFLGLQWFFAFPNFLYRLRHEILPKKWESW